jgi:hypothetical protein
MKIVSRIAILFPAILLAAAALEAQPATAVLREGTPVAVVFGGNLSSKTAVKGDAVTLELAGDLTVDGLLVARAGAKVAAHVASVKRAAAPGKSGELNLQLDRLDTGNATVPLRGSKARGQKDGVQYSLPYHLKWPMGLLRTGDDVEIKAGTTLTVFAAGNIMLPAIQ